jgi:hypothetical protein
VNLIGEGSNPRIEDKIELFDTAVGCALDVVVIDITKRIRKPRTKVVIVLMLKPRSRGLLVAISRAFNPP